MKDVNWGHIGSDWSMGVDWAVGKEPRSIEEHIEDAIRHLKEVA